MAHLPGGVESTRHGSEFENGQKTCCAEPPGCISPWFARFIEIGFIKVAARRAVPAIACACVRITARGIVQIAPGRLIPFVTCERIQIVAREFSRVAPGEFSRTARRKLVKRPRRQAERTAHGPRGAEQRPVRPRDG